MSDHARFISRFAGAAGESEDLREEAENLRCSMRWSSPKEISTLPRSAGARLWKRDNWMIQSASD